MKALTHDQLKKMQEKNEKFTLINVLSPDNFKKASIPNSINIPSDQPDFVRQVEQAAGGKDRKVIVYCGSFECPMSHHAAETLEESGFTEVYAYEGGMKEWLEKSGESQAAA